MSTLVVTALRVVCLAYLTAMPPQGVPIRGEGQAKTDFNTIDDEEIAEKHGEIRGVATKSNQSDIKAIKEDMLRQIEYVDDGSGYSPTMADSSNQDWARDMAPTKVYADPAPFEEHPLPAGWRLFQDCESSLAENAVGDKWQDSSRVEWCCCVKTQYPSRTTAQASHSDVIKRSCKGVYGRDPNTYPSRLPHKYSNGGLTCKASGGPLQDNIDAVEHEIEVRETKKKDLTAKIVEHSATIAGLEGEIKEEWRPKLAEAKAFKAQEDAATAAAKAKAQKEAAALKTENDAAAAKKQASSPETLTFAERLRKFEKKPSGVPTQGPAAVKQREWDALVARGRREDATKPAVKQEREAQQAAREAQRAAEKAQKAAEEAQKAAAMDAAAAVTDAAAARGDAVNITCWCEQDESNRNNDYRNKFMGTVASFIPDKKCNHDLCGNKCYKQVGRALVSFENTCCCQTIAELPKTIAQAKCDVPAQEFYQKPGMPQINRFMPLEINEFMIPLYNFSVARGDLSYGHFVPEGVTCTENGNVSYHRCPLSGLPYQVTGCTQMTAAQVQAQKAKYLKDAEDKKMKDLQSKLHSKREGKEQETKEFKECVEPCVEACKPDVPIVFASWTAVEQCELDCHVLDCAHLTKENRANVRKQLRDLVENTPTAYQREYSNSLSPIVSKLKLAFENGKKAELSSEELHQAKTLIHELDAELAVLLEKDAAKKAKEAKDLQDAKAAEIASIKDLNKAACCMTPGMFGDGPQCSNMEPGECHEKRSGTVKEGVCRCDQGGCECEGLR